MTEAKKKIAFYCSSTSWGGLEMNTVRYALWMKERGWDVLIFCVNGTKIQHHAVAQNVNTVSVNRNRKYFDLINSWRVSRLFEENKIALCWFRDTRDFSLLAWVKFFRAGKLKLIYHQAMQFGVRKKDIVHSLRFSAVDAWVSTLQFLAAQVRTQTNFPHKKIHVVPLGVDDDRLLGYEATRESARAHFKLNESDFVFGIIGRLDKLKGQHTAIEALYHLHQKGHKAHLLIVGESTLNEGDFYEQELKLTTQELELTDYVHFAPYTKKVELFYRAIDVFTLCSKGETFGTVTIEAMAFGLPIVGTNSSGTPEILSENCGLLFEPGNALQLAEQLHILITDKATRENIAANGRKKFLRSFSKNASISAMEKIIYDLQHP